MRILLILVIRHPLACYSVQSMKLEILRQLFLHLHSKILLHLPPLQYRYYRNCAVSILMEPSRHLHSPLHRFIYLDCEQSMKIYEDLKFITWTLWVADEVLGLFYWFIYNIWCDGVFVTIRLLWSSNCSRDEIPEGPLYNWLNYLPWIGKTLLEDYTSVGLEFTLLKKGTFYIFIFISMR